MKFNMKIIWCLVFIYFFNNQGFAIDNPDAQNYVADFLKHSIKLENIRDAKTDIKEKTYSFAKKMVAVS